MRTSKCVSLVALISSLFMAGCSTPLTHTALDLTPFGAILSAVGVLYWLVTAGALFLAAMRPKTARGKSLALFIVVALFGYLPIKDGWEIYKAKTRLAKAEAMFQERCKTAGEKIHRTAENVEEVLLMKIRPTKTDFSNQFVLDDPYGDDTGGDGYISNFLSARTSRGSISNGSDAVTNGYHHIEAVDPKGGKRYRYSGSITVVGRKDENAPNIQIELKRNPNYDLNIYAFTLNKVSVLGSSPRYGVTYDDISTREEREVWIAGSSLKVIDLQTNEIMAERIGYMMDRGQGSTSGGRSPWLLAARNACPHFPTTSGEHPVQIHQTRYFVEKVLHIKQAKRDN
jgi:hypothetical protein